MANALAYVSLFSLPCVNFDIYANFRSTSVSTMIFQDGRGCGVVRQKESYLTYAIHRDNDTFVTALVAARLERVDAGTMPATYMYDRTYIAAYTYLS